jgi:hypothetical protein
MSEGTATLRPGWWASGKAWLDADNRHVWVAHDCTTERVATMLPWPNWYSDGLHVTPSVVCDACQFHSQVDLGPPDDAYRCSATFEFDGRWCERVAGHGGAHQAGMVSWGEYDALDESAT